METKWEEVAKTLGATGEHPKGKIQEDDDGELRFAVGVTRSGEVFIDFGVAVKWIAVEPEQADELATILIANAQKAVRVKEVLQKQKEDAKIVGADGKPVKGK